jgi:hypothetical protein
MRKLALALLLLAPSLAHATPNLDIYGGRTDVKCATTTPYFHLEQIGTKWWFCTPMGHGFIAMSVSVGAPPNPTPSPCTGGNNLFPMITAKYGDASYNWGWQTLKRVTQWGFNSIGQDSVGFVQARATCSKCLWPGHTQPIPLPYIIEAKPAENAYRNVGGFISSAIKDAIIATNTNWHGYRGAALFDAFDPGLATVWHDELASSNPSSVAIRTNSPWVLAVFTDDSDFFSGAGASPDFITGKTAPNLAWTTLLTSPVQTYNTGTAIGNKKLVYTTTQNFSKTQALNPVTSCSISDPCSLRDYLWQKYGGSISALNKAWGSNYTTFDSTATQVTNEAFATGDGGTASFTHTTAHGLIDPYSIQVFVGGVDQMGDCPWVHVSSSTLCFVSGSATNTGTLGSPVANLISQATSTVNYMSGVITINFVTPPRSGVPITISYQYGGWMQGGTGLMDEDGSHSAWVGTNSWCLEGPSPLYPTYSACVNGGGGAVGAPNANPTLGADLDNWVSQFAAKYFKTMRAGLTAVGSHLPYFGLDVTGSYGAPAFSKFEQGQAPYVDGFFDGGFQQIESSSNAEWLSRLAYHTQYIGNKPFMMFNVLLSQSDSSYSCKSATGSKVNYPNQAARGQAWFDEAQALFTTPSFNGTIQVVGLNFWNWQDFQNLNQGLVTLSDNAYDGSETVTGTVPCSPPTQTLACGKEAANYGDAISHIRAANLLWLTLSSPTNPAGTRGQR